PPGRPGDCIDIAPPQGPVAGQGVACGENPDIPNRTGRPLVSRGSGATENIADVIVEAVVIIQLNAPGIQRVVRGIPPREVLAERGIQVVCSVRAVTVILWNLVPFL